MFRFNLIARRGDHEQVMKDLDAFEGCFDLDRGGLGEDVMDAAALGVLFNMVQEKDPDGVPWPDLSASYAAQKQIDRPGEPMGVYDGLMRDPAQIEGTRFVTIFHAQMEYGPDPVAQAHAIKFSEGGAATGTAQPPRPFYGLTAEAVVLIDARFDAAFLSVR